ncbi:radical SAM family heme chaperone HemW [Candidatus Binatia bacterium]|nr:radical SAM family heme chaperone HemW [Candidatus Binatia bacterium]
MTSQAVALYVHIPYCLAKCPYCDFNSYAARVWPEDAYADALLAELAHATREGIFPRGVARSIFFGGGTPSLFAPRTIARLLDGAARELAIASDVEITLEANPGTVDEERLAGFVAAGVNRLSFGIQSFHPELLLALGRRHSVEDSLRALAAARAAGVANLSLDLIYAVPGESLDACTADVARAVDIGPEHVSAYNLTYEKGTALFRDLQEGRVDPAPEELEVAMFHLVRDRLGAAGYAQYEISNYAQPGREARHNQAYWRGTPYLGLGAGAHSFVPRDGRAVAAATSDPADGASYGTRWETLRDPNRYMESIRASGAAIASREELTRAQAMGEACWLGLRERRGLDAQQFAARFATALGDAFPHVDELLADGLVEWHEPYLRLTTQGLLVADTVFASFQ